MSHTNDGGWGICLRRCKPVKEVALKILNNGHMYTYNAGGFPWTQATAF